jgi:[acyl-carrier-protein] S-malonyltransferase
MGRALHDAFPDVRRVYDEASAVLGYDVAALCFAGPADRLNLTEYTQPALLTASIAALRLLDPLRLEPAAVAGHSLGEYSAIVAAGGLDLPTAVGLVQKRGRYMSEAVPAGSGLVAALLGLDADAVRAACEEAASAGIVAPANYNCPGQIVIAGEKRAVERAIEAAKARGCRKAIPLPVSVPVHTPLMQPAADRLAKDLAQAHWCDLRSPLINNADARPVRRASDVPLSLVRQLPSPVRWEESVRAMQAIGVTTFIEVGPGTVLSGLTKRIAPDAVTLNIADPSSLEKTVTALSAQN